jgi:hypothetical protein
MSFVDSDDTDNSDMLIGARLFVAVVVPGRRSLGRPAGAVAMIRSGSVV